MVAPDPTRPHGSAGPLAAARALGLALGVVACQARAPRPPRPVPAVDAEVLSHFRLDERPAPGVPDLEVLERLPRVGPGPPVPLIGTPEGNAGNPTAAGGAEGTPAAAGLDPQDPDEADAPPSAPLEIEEVLLAVEEHFPLVQAALEEVRIAEGRMLQADGAFDTRLKSRGEFELDGYYQNDFVDVLFEQPTTLWGATFEGGYRLGAGDFAVYDGKRKTNEDGEFRLGVRLPLLKGRAIDPARVALWRSRIERQQADPLVLGKRLEATFKGAASYWKWVSAGEKRAIAERLLGLARNRDGQLRRAVEEGLLAEVNLIDNRRLIVEREATLVKAERALQEAAIQLSLFLRDADGNPLVPDDARLPGGFPTPRPPERTLLPEALELAAARRPELRALELERATLELERDLADNALLPDLDVGVYASQDVGGAVNDPDDKGPFELGLAVRFGLPLQRSAPRGKGRELEAKLNKLARELQLARDLVGTDVQDATSALVQSYQRLSQAEENVTLALRLESAERLQLDLGQSDLFRVNVREQQTAVAAAARVDVLSEHFLALARYRRVLGVPYDEVRRGLPVGVGRPEFERELEGTDAEPDDAGSRP